MSAYSPDPRDLEAPRAAAAGRDPLLARAARYARWDGTQQVPALDADEIIDALADDVMAEGDLAEALRRLVERGLRTSDPTRPDLAGLKELRERLRRRRDELQERYQLRDVLADVRQELDEIVAQERAGIERRLDEAATPSKPAPPDASSTSSSNATSADAALRAMLRDAAARRIDQLDALPRDVGGRIRKLEEYDFMEPAARDRFNTLTEKLRKQTLDRFVDGLSEAIQGTTPEELDANRDMVRDLNSLLEERLEGREPAQDQVDDFLAKHGRFFPGARTLDEIVDQLTQRMAAMQSLLRSMTPQQRAELQSMMDALLRDDRLRWDLARLASNMDQLMPDGVGESYDFSGEEPLGLEPALDRIGQLQALDALEDELATIESPSDLEGLDRDGVRNLLGDDAARDLDALDALARQLEEAGYLTTKGNRLELTPRGSRRIGQKVLDDLFAKLSRDAFGGHRIDRTGRGGEREETTKPYEFGDPFHLDIRGTIENALRRPENVPAERLARGESGVHLSASDFEVFRTEQLTKTSTVLLVDMSRSMLLRGCFLAAKKVAVALDTLIRTQFPHDDLTVIGFAYYARELRPEALAELTWHGYEYGTNLQHGLMLARRILARQRGGNRQIVVITDGEPTAHFENGQVEFSYPPTRRTIQETLREVQRCTRDGITINTFMLERSRALAEFVALMTRLNRGRAFYATPEHLGEYVLVDFVSGRTRGVG
ncbi:MAG TPA: VWA domain-containing protein [Candidatus Limnocylindrales bacterium]|nr:VWA domain-containing protein [Candidatus Limnocylindrales bacterium]